MDFLDKLLKYYNLSKDDYDKLNKKITLNDIPNENSFSNVKICRDLILKHINENNKILIYGDYDCDGMLATSILKIAFNELEYANVGYYIPNRYKDGYGLNVENVKKFNDLGYKLIICVDNGISQFDAIDDAINKYSMNIIICDHHEIKNDTLPVTPYIIHPEFSSLKTYCSGGYTSYVLASSLLENFNKYIFSLASISIISDLMLIQSENKSIVKYGIKLLNEGNFKQISLLAENNFIDENIISSMIAPKINSIGRMIDGLNVNIVVKYFSSKDNYEIEKIHAYIEKINEQRKELTRNFELTNFEINESAIVEIADVKEGLIGLIANKCLETYNKPTIIFSPTNDSDTLKGSIRTKNGINALELLKNSEDLLLSYGGHEFAGGLSITSKDFQVFRNKTLEFCHNKSFKKEDKKYINIGITEITKENYDILMVFGPFGYGNEQVLFKISDFPTSSLEFSKDNNHIILPLSPISKIVCFNFDKKILENDYISFLGYFKINYFKNKTNINFVIKTFC